MIYLFFIIAGSRLRALGRYIASPELQTRNGFLIVFLFDGIGRQGAAVQAAPEDRFSRHHLDSELLGHVHEYAGGIALSL